MNQPNKIWETIKSEKTLILTLLGLLFFGLFCWLFWDDAKEFGLNFFTEIVGASITIFVLDKLIKNREDKKTIPQKLAVYEDVRLYTSRYIGFWTNAFSCSVPEPEPENLDTFFSNKCFLKILHYLHLGADTNVFPPRKWEDWVIYNATEFKISGNRILDRHRNILDPVAYKFVHHLTESLFNNNLLIIQTLRHADEAYESPRLKVLGSYCFPPENEEFIAILGLINWCENEYDRLIQYSPGLKKITSYLPLESRELPPKAMMSDEMRQSQLKEVKEFRERHANNSETITVIIPPASS